MAAGILAIGFMLIATLFPVGMKMTATATERTIAAVVADEAFAKIRQFGIADLDDSSWPDDPNIECVNYDDVSGLAIDPCDYLYPSTDDVLDIDKRYSWSTLCRYTGDAKDFQITILVSRKTSPAVMFPYWDPVAGNWASTPWPKPVPVKVYVEDASQPHILHTSLSYLQYFSEGSVVIDNHTGRFTTVLERDILDIILADPIAEWVITNDTEITVWVVPPAVKNITEDPPTVSGRSPCVGIYQRVISF